MCKHQQPTWRWHICRYGICVVPRGDPIHSSDFLSEANRLTTTEDARDEARQAEIEAADPTKRQLSQRNRSKCVLWLMGTVCRRSRAGQLGRGGVR